MRRTRLPTLVTFAATSVVLPTGAALAQLANPAFPGAEGFGAGATMRKNNAPFAGEVYHVTSLADTNTPGTLRYGVRESGFPANGRVIVFDVGGTINLTASLDIKNVNGLYVAGQTAPSPVTIVGDTSQITSSNGKVTQNVILRHLTFRKGTGNGEDAITFAGSGTGQNLILDHVSASWAEDETLSVANNNTNVTVQYSIISESLNNADHGFGSLVRPRVDSNVTFHHNLYASNKSRNPRLGTYDEKVLTQEFRNNVVYNSSDRNGYAGGSSEAEQEHVRLNYVGNYVIAGPSSASNINKVFLVDKNVDLNAYQSGNFIDFDKQANPGGTPNGADLGWNAWQKLAIATDSNFVQEAGPIPIPAANAVITQSAIDGYAQVLNHAGNAWQNRDAVDARVVNNVRTNTGAVINNAAAIAAEYNAILAAPTTPRPAGWDTDGDGMPNAWETAHGLNPNAASPGDFDNDGYSNVEEYLNEVGAFPAPRAMTWSGGAAAGRYALNANWNTWQPSRSDTVNVRSGKAVVDAVGQHAGRLTIAPDAAAAELEVAAGWLDVAGTLEVGTPTPGGGAAAATLRLTGGTLFANGALYLNPTGTILLDGGSLAHHPAASFTWNGGTLRTLVDQTIPLNATISPAGGVLDTTDENVSYSGRLAGDGPLTKSGPGTLTLSSANTYAGGTTVSTGTLVAANADALGTGPLAVANGATTRARLGLPTALSLASPLGIAAAGPTGGTLDLTDNALVVRHADRAAALAGHAAVNHLVRNACNEFAWDRPGVTSSTVATDIANGIPSTIGILLNNDGAGGALFYGNGADLPLYEGRAVDANTVMVQRTLLGDGDLSGTVDSVDFALFQAGYTGAAPYVGFAFGDYDYNGVIDSVDFGLFQAGYQYSQSNPPTPEMVAFAKLHGLSLERAVVPEPAAIGLTALAVGVAGRMSARRRAAKRSGRRLPA